MRQEVTASRIDSRPASRRASPAGFVRTAAFGILFFAGFFLPAASNSPAPSRTAVVVSAVQDLFTRPDETSAVDDQVILGERVEVLEDASGFARVRTAAGEIAWIPERALRRGETEPAADPKIARVTSNFAHVYATPSFTKQKPLLTVPVGATMAVEESPEARNPGDGGDSWVRVRLPDGRIGFVAGSDVSSSPTLAVGSPSSWIAFGRRFLGATYTWGGTTPLGFDCSGLVQRIFREHGVVLKRNSYEQAFQDPQLVPVAFGDLRPGDLLFFGTADNIDHEAMWLGDGMVLQSTRHGVPGVQVTPFDSRFLKPNFRYARRLKSASNATGGPGLDAAKARILEGTLSEIAAASGARFGIYVEDVTTGRTLSRNPSLPGRLFNDEIPAGLHPQSGAVVGHKTGSASSARHDAAVVRLPDGREYVLVLLADDSGATEGGRRKVVEAARRMSRAVWEAMIAP